MKADFPAVLDACVLANYPVCDLLLRLAETPRLYSPFWSEQILDETQRTQTGKLNWPPNVAESMRLAMTQHFPDSCADHLHCAVAPKEVDEKDQHVVQAALRVGAEVIVTFNLKDFPSTALDPISVKARHPSEFLLTLFSIEPLLVARRLNEIAEAKNCRLREVAIKLHRHVPAFIDHFTAAAGLSIGEE